MTNPTTTGDLASYLDFEETWNYIQFNEPPQGTKATLLKRYIDAACAEAQGANGANRPLTPTQFQERHDGWSGEYILLRHCPVLQLVLCREWQSTGGFVTLPESTPESPTEGVQVDYATGRIMRTFQGYSWPRPFFPGSRNVEVTYVAGFNPVPPDIWMATMELVAYWWRNTQEAARTSPLRTNEYDNAQQGGLWAGVPNRIARVFQSYQIPTVG